MKLQYHVASSVMSWQTNRGLILILVSLVWISNGLRLIVVCISEIGVVCVFQTMKDEKNQDHNYVGDSVTRQLDLDITFLFS